MITFFHNSKTHPIIPSFRVLPNTRLEKEVQRIVQSFNVALHIFISSKYDIRNNNIYSRGWKYQLVSFCVTLFLCAIPIYRFFIDDAYNTHLKQSEYYFYALTEIIYFAVHSICLTILFILGIVHNNNYVSLILEIQTIYKSIDFSKSIRSYIVWNWVSLFSSICVDIYLYSVFYIKFNLNYLSVIDNVLGYIFDVMFISFDVNYILAIRVIILLTKYLDEWSKDVLNLNDLHENNELCTKLIKIYLNIVKTFNMYTTIFQVLVSLLLF